MVVMVMVVVVVVAAAAAKKKKKKVYSELENQVVCSKRVLYFTAAIKETHVDVVYSKFYSIAKDSVCTSL
jgi:hypothetical protein